MPPCDNGTILEHCMTISSAGRDLINISFSNSEVIGISMSEITTMELPGLHKANASLSRAEDPIEPITISNTPKWAR